MGTDTADVGTCESHAIGCTYNWAWTTVVSPSIKYSSIDRCAGMCRPDDMSTDRDLVLNVTNR